MERVAFLVEETGERIDCLLNPETFEVSRLAGVRTRGTARGQLIGAGLADDPLQFTGGGRTEIRLDVLFDVDFVEGKGVPSDVRTLTRRLWLLAENSAEERGSVRPPLVRLVWGKTWNVPGVVTSVAERFDSFDGDGSPRRSWLRMKLVRVAESAAEARASFEEELARANAAAAPGLTPGQPNPDAGSAVRAVGDGSGDADNTGVRFDLLANDGLGSPFRWRLLARHNGVANPWAVQPGTVLAVPPANATAATTTPTTGAPATTTSTSSTSSTTGTAVATPTGTTATGGV
ncbi:CIS tube protein [Actinopolymorpha pittospori]